MGKLRLQKAEERKLRKATSDYFIATMKPVNRNKNTFVGYQVVVSHVSKCLMFSYSFVLEYFGNYVYEIWALHIRSYILLAGSGAHKKTSCSPPSLLGVEGTDDGAGQ